MIGVSNAWKAAHRERLLPETFVEISMGFVDETVTGEVTGVNEADFSNSIAVVNNSEYKDYPKYAFLEHNLWTLDGSHTVVFDEQSSYAFGYVSEDDAPGAVTITLPSAITSSIPGITVLWGAEYETFPASFVVETKSGDTVVDTVTVTDNMTAMSFVEVNTSQCDTVTVTVTEWGHPEQRNRILGVVFGQIIVFTKNEIISYSHERSGSPLGTELTQNTIEFEVSNIDGRWNPLNPSGLTRYLYERQRVNVRYGMQTGNDVEWIQVGVFYLSEWRAPSNGITAAFVARDALEFMLNATYSRPYVEGVTVSDGRVYISKDAAVYINSDTHLVTVLPSGTPVKIYEKSVWHPEGFGDDPEDPGVMVYRIDQGWLWADYVNITSNTSLFNDLSSALWKCLPDGIVNIVSDELTNTRVSAPTSIVDMNVGEFVQQCAASYGMTMFQFSDGMLYIGDVDYRLTDYVIPLESSYLYPEVELTKPLRNVNMVQHYQFSSDTKIIPYAVNAVGEDITVDCSYLWYYDQRTAALAQKYIDWWKHREIVSGEFRADPRLELFDVVTVETKYGILRPVMITYLKYTYNGAFRGVYEGKVIEEA